MKEYLISVVLITALVALASHFLPDAAVGYGRLALGIVLLYAVLSPLAALLSSFPALPDLPELPQQENAPLYEQYAQEGFCRGIASAVGEKFSVAEARISVRAEGFDVQSMRAEKIWILLRGEAVFADGPAIKAFVEGEGLGECEVEIEIGTA